MPYNQNQLWGMNCSRESAVLMTHLRSCVPPRAHLFLRDVSPLGLKQFAETNHVAELATELFVFYAVLSSAVGKNPSMKENVADV